MFVHVRQGNVMAADQQRSKSFWVEEKLERFGKLLEVVHDFIFNVALAMTAVVAAVTIAFAYVRQLSKLQVRQLFELVIMQIEDAGFFAIDQGHAGMRTNRICGHQRLEMKPR